MLGLGLEKCLRLAEYRVLVKRCRGGPGPFQVIAKSSQSLAAFNMYVIPCGGILHILGISQESGELYLFKTVRSICKPDRVPVSKFGGHDEF